MRYSDTTQPLVNQNATRFSFRELVEGAIRSSKYYQAENSTFFLMWIETAVWGKRRCYPCFLAEEGGDSLYFSAGKGPDEIGANRRLSDRWELVINPEKLPDFCVTELSEKEFSVKFRALVQQLQKVDV